jgi:hypothetical protein
MMEKIKKMNVSLLTGENSIFKKIKLKENQFNNIVNKIKYNIISYNIILYYIINNIIYKSNLIKFFLIKERF